MNRRILKLAIPNIISNLVIPLLGMIDMIIAGRLGSDSVIGAIAVGAAIFGFIYWNFAFIRMGTSALTAQAYGARDLEECSNTLARSVIISLFFGLLLLLLQRPVGILSMRAMSGNGDTTELVGAYFYARIWAAPATLSLYSIHGWFIGMQNSRIPMIVAITQNFTNIGFSLWFVYGFDMGVAGIAWGTVATQYFGVLFSWIMWFACYRRMGRYVDWGKVFDMGRIARFFNVNKDIFLRNALNTIVYTFFTAASSRFGDTVLATNSILIQLLMFFSHMSDGFAYAAEALVGRFVGARNHNALRHAVVNMFRWCLGIAIGFALIYICFWRETIGIFTNSPTIVECARGYIGWIALAPLAGFAPFLMDGIMLGATQTRVLRNSMFLSFLIFFALFYSTVGALGNDALWISYITFIVSRGVSQYFMSGRLKGYIG